MARLSATRGGETQVARILLDAEVRRLEQFLDQDDLRALLRRLAHQLLGVGDVRCHVPAAGELRRRHGDFALRTTADARERSCEHLAGIEDALGIERVLEQSHGGDLRGGAATRGR